MAIVYGELFQSQKAPRRGGTICFEALKSLEAAEKYAPKYKTAVLNFANPIEAGGGVLRGADAQEEYLCRASNLYNIISDAAVAEYYNTHKRLMRAAADDSVFIGTDSLIYSPNVTVFKDMGGGVSGEEKILRDSKDWFHIDVITCAAPFSDRPISQNQGKELFVIFKRRIANIFEAAIENDAEALVLGAWGCGAFNNPPEIVAEAFKEVLSEERYLSAFEKVVFAVMRGGRNAEIFGKYFADKFNE
ncbi:MAG: TIGR02452 family protein [Butyrivibrio sp.]|nr:TIGR02452 family protein [Butyrivibrio sp.]